MRPVLFKFRGVEIHAYPAFLFLGLTFGVIAGTVVGSARGLDAVRLQAALLILIVPALVGSRLLYVLTHWRFYLEHRSLVWSRQEGGAALYGGLLLALMCSWPAVRIFGLSLGAFWDAATITILVGMILTKIGCLLNGCCAGRETSGWFGFNLPDTDGIRRRRVPVQLLESALAALLLAGALSWATRPFDGALFLAALTGYGAARLALESTRETVDRIAGFSVYRMISLMLVAGSVATYAAVWWTRR